MRNERLFPILTTIAICLAGLVFGRLATAAEHTFEWANPKPQGNGINALAFEDALHGYAVGNLGAGLKTTNGGQSWTVQTRYPDFQERLRDVMVVGSSGQLLAVGQTPGIYRSTNGGTTWSAVPNPSTATLNHLAAIPGTNHLSAVGGNGQIVRSTDGGVTWALRPSPSAFELRDQFWWDAANGYVVGDFVARRTTDGGLTWQPFAGLPANPSGTFTEITFHDAANGWLLEHFTTYRTTNGGVSWFERHGPFGQSPFYQEEALVLSATHRFVITNLEGAEIWETVDDATSWTKLYERDNTAGYTDIERLADGTLVVASTHGDLLRSTDGGDTWFNFVTSPEDAERTNMNVIAFLPDGRAFAGGSDGEWLESLDSGETWSVAATSPGFLTPNAITFRGSALGLVGGYGNVGQSRIARTTDGGANWISHSLAPSYVGYIQEIAFPSDAIAYAVTHGGQGINYVFRSTDGGQTWALRNQGLPTSERFETIFFLDVDTGFVGGGDFGSDAALWKTVNGGATWTPMSEAGLPQSSIQDMIWWDTLTGFVVGFDGASRTTDGGQTWTPVLNVPLLFLDFYDTQRGYAASYFDEWIWRTENGGVSWEIVGTPWEGAPYDIKAWSGGFVVCGGGSVILRAREDGAVGIATDPGAPSAGAGFHAIDVWPNPVRSSSRMPLTIAIESPVSGPVEIRLYDVSGRLIESLTRRAERGSNVFAWDGARALRGRPLAAGTYVIEARLSNGERANGRFVRLP